MPPIVVYYLITFLLALSSISYELILAQSLSAFLENTVLRYSVTIGLYMCSLGFGSLYAGDKWIKKAIINLLKIEVFLTFFGGFSVVCLFLADSLGLGRAGFNIIAHGFIILIGFLSGLEIPLLVKAAEKYESNSTNRILFINYSGAFMGTILFAFYLYPQMGLLPAAFLIGLINATSGLLLYTQEKQIEAEDSKAFYGFLYLLGFLFLMLSLCVIYAEPINNFFIKQYLS